MKIKDNLIYIGLSKNMNVKKYIDLTPSFQKIFKLFSQNNQSPILDHYAIRSFNLSNSLKPLLKAKYIQQKNTFSFPNHHATATWFYHSQFQIPRVFTSQYNSIYTDPNLINSNLDLNEINHYIQNPNMKPSFYLYQTIQDKNQYLAWTLLHRNLINHIAFETPNIHLITNQIKNNGFKINNETNPIQVSEDGLLLQSSIQADKVKYPFCDKEEWVPGGFVEFIERRYNPETGEKREGFETQNANVIFNSTKKD